MEATSYRGMRVYESIGGMVRTAGESLNAALLSNYQVVVERMTNGQPVWIDQAYLEPVQDGQPGNAAFVVVGTYIETGKPFQVSLRFYGDGGRDRLWFVKP